MDKKEHAIKKGIKITLPYIIYLAGPLIVNDKPSPQPTYIGRCLLIDEIDSYDKNSIPEVMDELESSTRKYFKELDEIVDAYDGKASFGGLKQKDGHFGFLLSHIFAGEVRQVIHKKIKHNEFKRLKYDLELQFLEIDTKTY